MKKALIVGNNYPHTEHSLRGCVNDAVTMKIILQMHYDFDEVEMLLDEKATTQNMLDALNRLVLHTIPGDTVFFHYSGHGSQMLDTTGEEADGLDEILVPYDLNWDDKVIRDDDLKEIFDKLPEGVNLTVTLDCCNSGGGLDQLNEYQPLGLARETIQDEGGRFLPPPNYDEMLEKAKGFKSRSLQHRDVNQTGVLMTGCQAHQTSADAYINGKYQGAFTYALSKVLADNGYKVSNITAIEEINKFMVDAGFTQRPQLDGPGDLFLYDFLGERDYESADLMNTFTVQPLENQPVSENITEEDKKRNNLPLIVGGLFLLAILGLAILG